MQQYPLLLGRNGSGYLKLPGTEHACLYARTGSGKTTSMVIPNCFSWPGSLVVLDVKGECFKATAGHRYSRLKQRVFKFEPTADDERSHRWNPLEPIERDSPARFDQVIRQSFLLFPEALQDTGNQKQFWEPAARQAFVAVCLLVAETPSEPLTMGNIYDVFARGDFHNWLTSRITARRQAGNPYSQVVASGVSDFLTGNQDLVEGIRKTVSTRLLPWMSPTVVSATDASDFDLRDLRRTPTTIYVSISPGHIERMRPLLRLMFGQIVNMNTDLTPAQDPGLKVPVLMVLDEFARLDKISALTQASQFVRGYGIRLLYVVQNKAQIRALYGQYGAIDVFDNLGVEIVFGTGDIELAKELENRMGDDTVLFDTKNRPRFMPWLSPSRQTKSQHPHRRPLMYDQEIVQMPSDEQLLLRPGMKPMRSKRIVWYKDPNFRDLECTPPEIPKLVITAREDDGSVVMPVKRVPRT